jgi:Nif-specific regulatory protein
VLATDIEEGSGSGLLHGSHRSDVALVGVYEISKLLAVPARLEVSLAGVLQLLAGFLDMRHGLIALLGEGGVPEVVVGSGWSEATAKRYFERLPERAIGRIVVTKMPLVIEHMKQDALFENWDFSEWGAAEGDSSFIGVPIKDRGNVIGTLTIDREHGDRPYFSFDEDVRFLTMIGNLVGQTVRLQRLIASDREWLMGEQRRLEKTIEHTAPMPERGAAQAGGIIGTTPAIRAVLEKVRRVARSHSTVLLRGESGTGKEMFAKALHEFSPRRKGPFVAVNCAALAESVLESELFGHEKGAFTGAVSQRKGRFELADGGTLFLDEIGEISSAFQAKLLRVLQLGEFERVGGTHTIKVDVRLVAATNRNLEESVAKGDFRADLYYRVSVVPIFLPALRERKGDIPLLAREFLHRFNAEHETGLSLTDSALAVLTSCYFPGNVRELENCVRRTATLAHGIRIVADDFACRHDECLSAVLWKKSADSPNKYVSLPIGREGALGQPLVPPAAARPMDACGECSAHSASATESLQPEAAEDSPDSERQRLVEAMETAGWVQAKAARLLGLTPRQIGYALRKHAIPVKRF